MRQSGDDYCVECLPDRTVITGVLRLHSPVAYEGLFAPLQQAIEGVAGAYTIDLTGVMFMNSSGVTAISRVVLAARSRGVPLKMVGSEETPWHRKTLQSLARLHPSFEIELV